MSTWLLLGGLIVALIIVGMALEIWENRRIDREAHSSYRARGIAPTRKESDYSG